jgi:hypothetical protein
MLKQSFVILLGLFLGTARAFMMSPTKSTVFRGLSRENKISVAHLSPIDFLETSSNLLSEATQSDYIPGTSGDVSYSRASYYVILALYLSSFPGLWSIVKRSTTAKVKRKTFVSKGENAKDGKGLREQAGEIMAYMKANNYEVVDAGETITFRGIVQRSTSQAFFLVFCTAVALASLALVLQIQFQNLGTFCFVSGNSIDVVHPTYVFFISQSMFSTSNRTSWDWRTKLVLIDSSLAVCWFVLLEGRRSSRRMLFQAGG